MVGHFSVLYSLQYLDRVAPIHVQCVEQQQRGRLARWGEGGHIVSAAAAGREGGGAEWRAEGMCQRSVDGFGEWREGMCSVARWAE